MVKNLLPMQKTQEMQVRSLHQEDLLDEEMAIHSSILAWKIPWTEEPRGVVKSQTQLNVYDVTSVHFSSRISIYAHQTFILCYMSY